MRDLNQPEPPPQSNDKPAAWDLVIADMRERDAMGLAKYGSSLTMGATRSEMPIKRRWIWQCI